MIINNVSSIEAVQNSAFCAVIISSFGRGYQEEMLAKLPLVHFAFLVLPLILHRPTLDIISSTNQSSGFGKFVEKLSRQREDLIAVHGRALIMRRLTLDALSTGVASGLLSILYEEALFRANDVPIRRSPERIKPYTVGAEKLGHWMTRVPPASIFSLLRVRP